MDLHISRRGSINITNGSLPMTPTTAAALPSKVAARFVATPATASDLSSSFSSSSVQKLAASRTKLAELQAKSRSLSASLRRHEHLMTNLASDTAAVEEQAQRQVNRRLGSPAWSKYGNNKSVIGTSSRISRVSSVSHASRISASTPSMISSSIPPTSARTERADAAYIEGFKRQKEMMKREMTVALARDLADVRARNEELQHASAMSDVQQRVTETEVIRLRGSERKFMEKVTSLSRTVSELKSHLDRQQDHCIKVERSGKAFELEAESTLQMLSETRQMLTTEKVEREALARQVIALNDERNALHRELTALQESETTMLDEVRRERSDFYQTQQDTRSELEELQQELHRSIREAANFRASALSYRVRSEEAESALANVQQVHKATIEQLVNTRERLKREQDARWNAESEAARLRGASLG